MQLETSFLFDKNKALIHSVSSETDGCSSLNLLNNDKKTVWLTEEDLPQHVTFNIAKLIQKPPYITGFGIYCSHSYPTNPKLIEILISKDASHFISLGHFELSLSSGIQILSIDKLSLDKVSFIKFLIKEVHGGTRVYINKIYLYREIPPISEYVLTVESKERIPSVMNQLTDVIISDSDISDKIKNIPTEQILITGSNYSNKKQHETSMQMDTNNINIITDYDNDNDPKETQTHNKKEDDNDDNAVNNYLITKNEDNYLNTDQAHSNNNNNQKDNMPRLSNETSNSNMNNNQMNYNSNTDSQNMKQSEGDKHQEQLLSFESRISNLENDVGEIKMRLGQVNQNVETLVEVHNNYNQNNYNYILSECKKIINSKIGNLLCSDSLRGDSHKSNRHHEQQQQNQPYHHHNHHTQLNTYHEYMRNQRRKKSKDSLSMAAIESSITSRLDQKLSNFCSQLESRIYNIVLKPTMDHLESNLQNNLTEVHNQLKSAEKKMKKHKAKEKKQRQEEKLDYLLSKVEKRLSKRDHYYTCNPTEHKTHDDVIHIKDNDTSPQYNYTTQNKEVSIHTLTLEEDN